MYLLTRSSCAQPSHFGSPAPNTSSVCPSPFWVFLVSAAPFYSRTHCIPHHSAISYFAASTLRHRLTFHGVYTFTRKPVPSIPFKIYRNGSRATYRLENTGHGGSFNPELYDGPAYVWLTFSAGTHNVTVSAIRFVCQVRPSTYAANFSSSSLDVDRVWHLGAYTVRATMLQTEYASELIQRGDREDCNYGGCVAGCLRSVRQITAVISASGATLYLHHSPPTRQLRERGPNWTVSQHKVMAHAQSPSIIIPSSWNFVPEAVTLSTFDPPSWALAASAINGTKQWQHDRSEAAFCV